MLKEEVKSSLFLYSTEQQIKHKNDLVHLKGAISGTALTIEILVAPGTIKPNMLIINAAPETYIVKQLSGEPGKVGTYLVSKSQNLGLSILKCLLSSFQEVNLEFGPIGPNESGWNRSPDVAIKASIDNDILIVYSGTVIIGGILKGKNIKEDTKILSQLTGVPGKSGTYHISIAHKLEKQIFIIKNNSRLVCNEEGWYNIDYKINMRVISPDNFHYNYVRGAAYLAKIVNNDFQQISGSGDTMQSSDKNHQHDIIKRTLVHCDIGDQLSLQFWAGYYSGAPSVLQTSVQGLSIGNSGQIIPIPSFEESTASLRITKVK